MAATAPMPAARQPFAELSGQRLQHLTSLKNRQNGLVSTPTSNCKSPLSQMMKASPSPVTNSKKRGYEPTTPSEEFDSENVDPSNFLSPSKKSRGLGGALGSSSFSFTKPTILNVIPSTRPAMALATPRANIATPRAPATAPIGRSPPRKTHALNANRRISAPYTRIDPPSAMRRPHTDVPFSSFEEALAGTLKRPVAPAVAKPLTNDLAKSMPKSWFFDIHEDTPQQEAENLMEHSTNLLDLSSDDDSNASTDADKGKENIAPVGFVAPVLTATQASAGKGKKGKVQRRRKVVKVDVAKDEVRSPLSEVEREDFFPEGVTAAEFVVVAADADDVAATVQTVSPRPSVKKNIKLAGTKASMSEDIVIFED